LTSGEQNTGNLVIDTQTTENYECEFRAHLKTDL